MEKGGRNVQSTIYLPLMLILRMFGDLHPRILHFFTELYFKYGQFSIALEELNIIIIIIYQSWSWATC
jgi:hypothetical protein